MARPARGLGDHRDRHVCRRSSPGRKPNGPRALQVAIALLFATYGGVRHGLSRGVEASGAVARFLSKAFSPARRVMAEAHFFGVSTDGYMTDDDAAADALREYPFPRGARTKGDHEAFDRHERLLRRKTALRVAELEPVIRAFATVLIEHRRIPAAEANTRIEELLARHGRA